MAPPHPPVLRGQQAFLDQSVLLDQQELLHLDQLVLLDQWVQHRLDQYRVYLIRT